MTTNENRTLTVQLTKEQQQMIKNAFKGVKGYIGFCLWLYKEGQVYVMVEKMPAEQISEMKYFHGVNTENQFSRYYNVNIELVLGIDEFKKDYPYSGIDDISEKVAEIINNCQDISWKSYYKLSSFQANYMSEYPKARYLEQVFKACPSLLESCLENSYNFIEIKKYFRNGKTVSEITRMPNWLWKKTQCYGAEVMDQIRIWYNQSLKQGNPLTEHDIDLIKEMFPSFYKPTIQKMRGIIRNAVDENGKQLFTTQKLVNYLKRIDTYQAIYPGEGIMLLFDYVTMCKQMRIVPITDSNSLKREHDVTARIYNGWKREQFTKEQTEKFVKVHEKLSKYAYSDNRLVVVVPKTPQDLVNEGRGNRNCVASYVDSYAKGKSEIFFIRKKDDPEKSYITIETYGNGENLSQAFYASNQPINNANDMDFITKWLIHNKEVNTKAH